MSWQDFRIDLNDKVSRMTDQELIHSVLEGWRYC